MDGVDGLRQCQVMSCHVTSRHIVPGSRQSITEDSVTLLKTSISEIATLAEASVLTFRHHVQPGPFRKPFFQVLSHIELRDESGLLPRQTGGVDHEDHRCGQVGEGSEGQLLHFVTIFSGPALQLRREVQLVVAIHQDLQERDYLFGREIFTLRPSNK